MPCINGLVLKGFKWWEQEIFTHPAWFNTLKKELTPTGNGFFKLKQPPKPLFDQASNPEVQFCLTTEISNIYKHNGKVRRNHNLLYAPDFETVEAINQRLAAIGNLKADGRPILGLSARDLLEIILEVSDQAYLIPAHIWTPWFSTLGAKSGYDNIDECFRDLAPYIFALETGLSSDPAMNWQWSALDRFTLVSNSDAHSPQKLGREANKFDTELSYEAMFRAIKDRKGFLGTIEFFPEEGKYHYDGHRQCNVCLEPSDTKKLHEICPVCGRKLTVGVLNRLTSLADRSKPQQPKDAPDFEYIVPLPEIIAEIESRGVNTKTVHRKF